MALFLETPAIVQRPVGQAGSQIGESRLVNIQPMNGTAAFDTFTVEVANPKVLYDEYEGLTYYEVHGRVLALGKTFAIKAVPSDWPPLSGIGGVTSHVMILLEEVRE